MPGPRYCEESHIPHDDGSVSSLASMPDSRFLLRSEGSSGLEQSPAPAKDGSRSRLYLVDISQPLTSSGFYSTRGVMFHFPIASPDIWRLDHRPPVGPLNVACHPMYPMPIAPSNPNPQVVGLLEGNQCSFFGLHLAGSHCLRARSPGTLQSFLNHSGVN